MESHIAQLAIARNQTSGLLHGSKQHLLDNTVRPHISIQQAILPLHIADYRSLLQISASSTWRVTSHDTRNM